MSNFIIQALRDQPITIYNRRLLRGYGEGGRFPRFRETRDPNEFSIRELADMVIAITGSKSKIESSRCLPTIRCSGGLIFR